MAWHGMERHGTARHGTARHGVAWDDARHHMRRRPSVSRQSFREREEWKKGKRKRREERLVARERREERGSRKSCLLRGLGWFGFVGLGVQVTNTFKVWYEFRGCFLEMAAPFGAL